MSTTSSEPDLSLSFGPEDTHPVDSAVTGVVVQAYYEDAVKAGSSARTRAQAAQSAATVFAALLLGALTVNMDKQSNLLRAVGAMAVLLWSVASILYMLAVGTRGQTLDLEQGAWNSSELVRIALRRAKRERDLVDRRQRLANMVAAAALLASATTFALTAFSRESEDRFIWQPPESYLIQTKAVCNRVGLQLTGTISESSHESELYELNIDAELCGGRSYVLHVMKRDAKGVFVEK